MKMLIAFLFLGFSSLAHGQLTLSEAFYSTTHFDSANSTLIWNPYFHMIHPPLEVSYTWNANLESLPGNSVGNGQDGIFDVGTYSNFSVGGVTPGNVITIDTSVHPVIQVIYFNLASGWSIKGIGPNPLWIESFGPVTIAGLINCSGDNGQASDNITTSPTIGGSGHCGGGNGGNGGYNGGIATAGATGGGTTTGGVAGGFGNIGGGGGGGGGYRTGPVGLPQTGLAAGTGGAGGPGGNDVDPKFTVFGPGVGGGAGGGGGGYDNVGLFRGASGGGGGGVIRITAVGNITVNTGGKLWTNGGFGGGASGGATGGGGGGGAGGGIWLQTAGGIFDNGGAIDAGAYAGGPDPNNEGIVPGGSNGGLGSDGRTWLTCNTATATPASETPSSELLGALPFDEGSIHFSVAGGYVAQSLAYDSQNTAPIYTLFSMLASLPGTAAATILVSGSNDNFVNDNTGFIPISNLTPLAAKRFFKFQVTLQQDSTSAPASTASNISMVTATYNGYVEKNFQFAQACGYLAGGPPEGLFLFTLFGIIYFSFCLKRRRLNSLQS